MGLYLMNKSRNHKVLLIDDDEKLANLLFTYFAKFDIQLLSATLPSKGLEAHHKEQPDLVILDVMLPEMDGFEVCRALRKTSNTPIIMLTARGDVDDRVLGLGAGADDYLPKPFEPRELVARIDSILARVQEEPTEYEPDVIKFKDLTINRSSYEVQVRNQPVDLTTKEYALLIMMVDVPGKVFSRDDIMNELSGIDSELFSRSVDILVSRLRNKLKPLDYIETVWGIGYRFSED